MNKKIRARIPQENKIRAELQKEIDSICPFCDNTDVGHFEIHHIDENPSNNDKLNLILLCRICHSKITKGDISLVEVYKKKLELISNPELAKKRKEDVTKKRKETVKIKGKNNKTIIGNNNTLTINQIKKNVKEKYPLGCIGHDNMKANYIAHLIKRYNEYKAIEVGKGNVKYGVFNGHLKKKFRIGPTRTIYNLSIEKFDELVEYIHERIKGTMFAKQKGSYHKNYSTYEDFVRQETQKETEINVFLYESNKYAIYCGSTIFFEGRICDTFPGVRGVKYYDNPIECVNKLEMLLKNPLKFDYAGERSFTDPIWWERGNEGNLQIERFKKLTNSKCLINADEYEIKRIAVYHSQSRYKNFVYVEVNPENSTGLYPEITKESISEDIKDGKFPREEYAVFSNRLITRAEYDDGSAEIDGKVVEIYETAELRVRHLSPYNFIIAAKASVFNCEYPDELRISNYLNKLLKNEIDFQEFINFVEKLPKNRFGIE